MAKQVIAYAAEDGSRFDTEAEAAEHDLRNKVRELTGLPEESAQEAFVAIHAETILPYIKALVDGRVRTLSPQPQQPLGPIGSPGPQLHPQPQQPPMIRHKPPTAEEMRGLPSGGGVVRGASTGWSVAQENGQWFCTNGLEKGGPFNKRSDAVAHFRAKESAARV
jgi:hypothetical protein